MKTVICLLFPVLLFAQNPFPDTLLLIDGRTYPCIITNIDDSKVEFLYLNNKSESILIKAVEQLSIEGLGAVYKFGNGFTTDFQKVEVFIENRNKRREEESIIKEELARLSSQDNYGQVETKNNVEIVKKKVENKNWSFGVLYVPYYSGIKYSINNTYYPPSPPETYSYSESETNLEGQLSYGFTSDLRVTLDAAYSSSFAETRYEQHVSGNYFDDSGSLRTLGLKLIDFSIGVKYFFKDIVTEKVSSLLLPKGNTRYCFNRILVTLLKIMPKNILRI